MWKTVKTFFNNASKDVPKVNQTDDILFFFLQGTGKNLEHRYLHDIWEFSFEELEKNHDYIQWLFPLKEKSRFNPSAPVLSDVTRYQTKEIRENMIKSLDVLLDFYGLKRLDGEIVRLERFEKRKDWISKNNHNYLRMTRILKSLVLFGLEKEAKMFLAQLETIYLENKETIGEKTFQFWKEAV